MSAGNVSIFHYELNICTNIASAPIISVGLALFQIIELIIFALYRNEDGIICRRPIFTYSFCLSSTIYLIFVIPLNCSTLIINDKSMLFLFWFLVRCGCIFVWFWTLICKQWLLYFDYNYVILLRLQAMHTITNGNIGNWKELHLQKPKNDTRITSKSVFESEGKSTTTFKSKWFVKHKKDYGHTKKASFYVAIYFLICFVLLFLLGMIHQTSLYSLKHFFQILEIIFLSMCIFPFCTIILFIFRIWPINESWKIKEEIYCIFMLCSVLFLIDIGLTAFVHFEFFDEYTRFTLKLTVEAFMFIFSTLISTLFVVRYIVSKKEKSNKRRNNMSALRQMSPLSDENFDKKKTMSLKRGANFKKREIVKERSHDLSAYDVDENEDENEKIEIPLGYILANQMGYNAFLQHITSELNVENLLFLAHICYFKKKFLNHIKQRQLLQNDQKKRNKKDTITAEVNEEEIEPQEMVRYSVNIETVEDVVSEHEDLEIEASEFENNGREIDISQSDMLAMESDDDIIELESFVTKSFALTPKQSFDATMDNDNNNMAAQKHSIYSIKTDVATYGNDNDNGHEHDFMNVDIDWSPSNCLGILTFRMCHNFERDLDNEEKENVNDNDLYLYVSATDLYKMFICEESEYEVNLSSKVRTNLHFYFHQNFADLDISDLQYHEYRLFHIFDTAWKEIWNLLILNSYRRFLDSEHYKLIRDMLEIALNDERPSLYRLIVLDSNYDRYIAEMIEVHDPYKRKKIIQRSKKSDWRMHGYSSGGNVAKFSSMNIEEMHELKPICLVDIGVKTMPIHEQIEQFGKLMVKGKKAQV